MGKPIGWNTRYVECLDVHYSHALSWFDYLSFHYSLRHKSEETGSVADFILSSHLCSTWVMRSTKFWINGIRATPMDSSYSSTSNFIVSNCRQSNISLVAFVHTLVFMVSVSTSQWYTLTKSVFKCMTLHFHCNARLMSFSATSSLAKLMCWASFMGCSQHASSKTTSSRSRSTLVARELASTHTLMSCPVVHHRPGEWSLCVTLAIFFWTICNSGASSVVLPHPRVTALALRFIIPVVAQSHPHTGRCLISFPHREKIVCVTTSGTSGIMLPSQSAMFPPDFQSKNLWTVFKPLRILAL